MISLLMTYGRFWRGRRRGQHKLHYKAH